MGSPSDILRRRRTPLLAALCVGVAVVVVVLVLSEADRPTVAAEQYGAPAVRVGSADARAWAGLSPEDGSLREGWPTPMLARDTEFCFGFGRVDFSPTRPAVARCVDAIPLSTVPPNGIVAVMMIKAGLDNWHILVTGSQAESFELLTADAGSLAGDRVHIAEDVVVLRLPAGLPVGELSWVNGRNRYVCTSVLDAAATGRFCGATAEVATN